ncbi:MAG: histidinol-phosphatase [Bacteroidales bacterium]|nr:histidinol-phosphatase [Bacteroidales bacterium]
MRNYPFNLHSHTNFSDGSNPPDDYIKAAIKTGLEIYGFSDHAPIPKIKCNWCIKKDMLKDYFRQIRKIQKENKHKIKILVGLEVDYIPEIIKPSDFHVYKPDYIIGSVHFLKLKDKNSLVEIDSGFKKFEDGMKKHFNGNIEQITKYYYSQIIDLIKSGGFQILGHVDKIRVWIERINPEVLKSDWYNELIKEVAEESFKSGIYVEINTRGMYKGVTNEPYPSWDFIKILDSYNVKMILNADTHRPDGVDSYYGVTLLKLEIMDVKNLVVYIHK